MQANGQGTSNEILIEAVATLVSIRESQFHKGIQCLNKYMSILGNFLIWTRVPVTSTRSPGTSSALGITDSLPFLRTVAASAL